MISLGGGGTLMGRVISRGTSLAKKKKKVSVCGELGKT